MNEHIDPEDEMNPEDAVEAVEPVSLDADQESETDEPVPEMELSMADRLIAMEAEKTAIKDQLLRSMAEMENISKRAERKVAEARVFAIEKFAGDLLNVSDNLARALSALTDEARADLSDAGKSLLEGIELTEKELIATMARHGVTTVDSIAGTAFDPNVHQAVAQIPSDQPEGTVAEPFQTGWKIGDRTLRAAMVAVSTGPEA